MMGYEGCGIGECPTEAEHYHDLCADCQRGCADRDDDGVEATCGCEGTCYCEDGEDEG